MKRVVLKFGTGVLTRANGCSLLAARFRQIAEEIAELHRDGWDIVVVSSAAVAAGVDLLRLPVRPEELAGKQACAAAGQPRLMRMYEAQLQRHGLHAAQLLLTHGDVDSVRRRQNARCTLDCLLETRRVIPIVNENDSVSTEELRVGDNDRLSAEVAILADADLLVLLTSSDGLLDGSGRRVPVVVDMEVARKFVTGDKGAYSIGGMATKLQAVELALGEGVEAVIADGRKPGQILAAVRGEEAGTRFPVSRRRRAA